MKMKQIYGTLGAKFLNIRMLPLREMSSVCFGLSVQMPPSVTDS